MSPSRFSAKSSRGQEDFAYTSALKMLRPTATAVSSAFGVKGKFQKLQRLTE